MDVSLAFELVEKDMHDVISTSATPSPQSVFTIQESGKPQQRRKYTASTSKGTASCYRCGGSHPQNQCRFREAECHFCHKKGHISKVCNSKKRLGQQPERRKHETTFLVTSADTGSPTELTSRSDDDPVYSLFSMGNGPSNRPPLVDVHIDAKPISMQVDTGASVTVLSKVTYSSFWPVPPTLQNCNSNLTTYSGEKISVLGKIAVHVSYKDQQEDLSLLVFEGSGPPLLGRDWLKCLKLDWNEVILSIRHSQENSKVSSVLDKYASIFLPGLGTFSGQTVDINLQAEAKANFFKVRTVPFVLKQKIEDELDRLVREGVITPVASSPWAAPIVPVTKQDGSVWICGDYKLTLNPVSIIDSYPLPRIDEIFTALSGGKYFSKLDLSHAYLQLRLSEASQPLTTINTHKGLFQYCRLPFGIASAPAMFQRTMDNLLKGLNHTTAYIDDIVVSRVTDEEHLRNLDEVLRRLNDAGVRLKKEKCRLVVSQVEYLGHLIDGTGLHLTPAKIRAIKDAPVPHNVAELRSFLGLINYYGKFIKNLSGNLSPLYSLLQKQCHWTWGQEQETCFRKAKDWLSSPKVLVHYDPSKELILSCDASSYGLGAVLAHSMSDGSENPISFASRSLSQAEKKDSQIDKESLAIVFGVTKFHQYLYGRNFTLFTDHKPLTHLFHPSKSVPQLASARIQRWALTLGAYSYQIKYRRGIDNSNADALSRLPLPDIPENTPVPGEVLMTMSELSKSPINATDIWSWTSKDPVLSSVYRYVVRGWPITIQDKRLQIYHDRKDELSVEDGCILRGARVVIPERCRSCLLEELHQTHMGITRMKSLARGYVWWPSIDSDLEKLVKGCQTCQINRPSPPLAQIHPWQWPECPWTRIHVDYAGPFMGKMFLLIVDAHSKWHMMSCSNSRATIESLRHTFATFDIPKVLVSDNGPAQVT